MISQGVATVKVERLDNPVPFKPEDSKLPKIDFEMAEFEPKHYFEKKEKAREKAEAKIEAKEKAPHHRHTPCKGKKLYTPPKRKKQEPAIKLFLAFFDFMLQLLGDYYLLVRILN